MTKCKTKVQAYATFHPDTGLNAYWVRSQAKQIRGEPGTSTNAIWKGAVKRGWRIVRVTVALSRPQGNTP